jgi:hypothetical protein
MLKFFRRIRKALLDSGSVHKYLLYAIGEIALVVIGILIALQVNNWNQDIAKEKNIRGHLANLIDAIEMDSSSFHFQLVQQGFRFHAIKYLIELTGNEITEYGYEYTEFPSNQGRGGASWDRPIPTEYNEEFIKRGFGWVVAGAPSGIIINRSAIEEFRTNGLFSAMKNEELKKKILTYYRRGDAMYTGRAWEYKLDLSLQVQECFLYQYDIDIIRIENIKDVIDKIKSEKILLGNLQLLLDNVSWSCQTFLLTKRWAAELLVDLRAELNISIER